MDTSVYYRDYDEYGNPIDDELDDLYYDNMYYEELYFAEQNKSDNNIRLNENVAYSPDIIFAENDETELKQDHNKNVEAYVVISPIMCLDSTGWFPLIRSQQIIMLKDRDRYNDDLRNLINDSLTDSTLCGRASATNTYQKGMSFYIIRIYYNMKAHYFWVTQAGALNFEIAYRKIIDKYEINDSVDSVYIEEMLDGEICGYK